MISIRKLCKEFTVTDGKVAALKSLDLEVAEGEFFVIVGASGSGKTTLLRCVAGLESPDKGEIRIAGKTVFCDAPPTWVSPQERKFGMVFQSYAVWPHLTVFENVALPLREGAQKIPRREVNQRVQEAQRQGVPLGYAIMDDATISHTRYAGVPKNSRAPNTAALFIVFLHTVEGQKMMWDIDGLDFHLYPESNQKKKLDAAKAKGAKVVISSPQWLNKNKNYDATQKELEKILRGEVS